MHPKTRHKLAAFAALIALAAPEANAAASPATQAGAPKASLDISLACVHLTQRARDTLNQFNPGLGVTYNFTPEWSTSAGLYRNSLRRNSLYALGAWTPLHWRVTSEWRLDLGGEAGVLTGYSHRDNPAAPFGAAGLIRLRNEKGYGANVVIVPNHGASAGFVGLQIVVPFGAFGGKEAR